LYSQAEGVVLESLGEDPQQFEKLRQGIYASFSHAAASHAPLIESLAAAMWELERIDRRIEDLEIKKYRNLTADGEPFSDKDRTALLRALSMEACAFRDFMRISNQLMEAQFPESKPPLLELPQKVLKTKAKSFAQRSRR
jgi:uncharacterized membrane protein YccC